MLRFWKSKRWLLSNVILEKHFPKKEPMKLNTIQIDYDGILEDLDFLINKSFMNAAKFKSADSLTHRQELIAFRAELKQRKFSNL